MRTAWTILTALLAPAAPAAAANGFWFGRVDLVEKMAKRSVRFYPLGATAAQSLLHLRRDRAVHQDQAGRRGLSRVDQAVEDVAAQLLGTA